MKRLVLLPTLALLVAAGCGRVPLHAAQAPVEGTAFVLTDMGAPMRSIAPIDLATGKIGSDLPGGVMSPDGRRLYVVSGTTLKILDPATGDVLGGYPMPAGLVPPQVQPNVPAGLSHNGKHLVLESSGSHPARSSFWVLDLAGGRGSSVNLDGDFEFDGISDSGLDLYLLQWLPNQPGRYSVRQYDLGARVLEPYTLTDKTENLSSMRGTRLASVGEPTGQWQYTLYVGGQTGAFVHALQVGGGFSIAWCVDLPATDPVTARGWSIAMTPDGSTLYAANAMAGKLAVIHPHGIEKPTIDRVTDLGAPASSLPGIKDAEAKELGGAGLGVLDSTHLYAAGPTGVRVIDLKSGRETGTLLPHRLVHSIAMAPGGHELLALDDANWLVRVDTATGDAHVVASGLGYPLAIVGVTPQSRG